MRGFHRNRIQTIFALILCFMLVGLTGCEKLSFLEKYFPSLFKGKKPAVVTPSAPVATVPQAVMGPDTLARVGAWTMTVGEFNEKLKSLKELFPEYNVDDIESKKTILEELIRQELLVADAEKSGVAKNQDVVNAVNEFRRTLLVQEMAAKVTEKIAVTEQEARAFYDQNKESFADKPQWHIREILVSTKEGANAIYLELLKGTDFGALAKERSIAQSAKDGGDLGFVTEFKSPKIESAVAILEKGETTNVVQGADGYYIVKLEEKKAGQAKDFTELREDIMTGLKLMKQQQAILDYIENLKKNTSIEINAKLLGN